MHRLRMHAACNILVLLVLFRCFLSFCFFFFEFPWDSTDAVVSKSNLLLSCTIDRHQRRFIWPRGQ
jgi:hypothetical protein